MSIDPDSKERIRRKKKSSKKAKCFENKLVSEMFLFKYYFNSYFPKTYEKMYHFMDLYVDKSNRVIDET